MSNRFFLPPELFKASEILFPPDTARQIARVLRLRPGARVIVLDNAGQQAEVELTAVNSDSVEGRVLRVSSAGGRNVRTPSGHRRADDRPRRAQQARLHRGTSAAAPPNSGRSRNRR